MSEPILKCENCGKLVIIPKRRATLPNKQRFCHSKCAFAWHNKIKRTEPKQVRKLQREIFDRIHALPEDRRRYFERRLEQHVRAHTARKLRFDTSVAQFLLELFEVCELDGWHDESFARVPPHQAYEQYTAPIAGWLEG
jgi:hypothetical protein